MLDVKNSIQKNVGSYGFALKGLVFMAEAMNTAIEKLCDHLPSGRHKMIGKAKDMAAAGVLILANAAAVIGVMVFWVYFQHI